jgi:hypothetical protein
VHRSWIYVLEVGRARPGGVYRARIHTDSSLGLWVSRRFLSLHPPDLVISPKPLCGGWKSRHSRPGHRPTFLEPVRAITLRSGGCPAPEQRIVPSTPSRWYSARGFAR